MAGSRTIGGSAGRRRGLALAAAPARHRRLGLAAPAGSPRPLAMRRMADPDGSFGTGGARRRRSSSWAALLKVSIFCFVVTLSYHVFALRV